MKIRYIGTESYQEYPVTGTTALWQPEWVSDVSTTRATSLVGLGTFVYEDESTWANQLVDRAAELAALGVAKQSDSGIDYIAYGLTLPTSGTIGVAAIAAGVAYVSGRRVAISGQVLSLTATSDNYIDVDYDGNVVVSAVAVAAGAPAKAANSIRLGYCTTNSTSVTGATTGAKDSNGNWMGNYIAKPYARVLYVGSQACNAGDTAFVFGAGTTLYDNDSIHSEVTDNTRFTVQHSGLYEVSFVAIRAALGGAENWSVKINKNGASAAMGTMTAQADKTLSLKCGGQIECKVGDYIQGVVNVVTTSFNASAGALMISRID